MYFQNDSYCGTTFPSRLSPRLRAIQVNFLTNSFNEFRGFQLFWIGINLGKLMFALRF